jgi:hypothetical protein
MIMYEIFINKLPYSFNLGFITGFELRKIGHIPASHLLKFLLSKSKDFIEINDNDSVDLTRAGAEYFTSEKK